jgi:hypothetical protein
MPDVLPFHVSFLRTIDNYERPPIDLTYVAPNPLPSPKSREQIERAKDPFAMTFKNRGFVRILDFFPTILSARIARLTHNDATCLFSEKPVFHLHSGACAVSDSTAVVLKRFNLGRSDLVWLDPPPEADPNIFRGAWTLWPAERYPTVYTPRFMHGEQPPYPHKASAFVYDRAGLKVTGIAYSAPWHDRNTLSYPLPCRQPDTDVDLWVDPLWPQSLFLSNRLVEALEAEGLLMGTKDGWRTCPCRAPLPEDIVEDQVQPWVRTITDQEWETMSEDAFRDLGERALSEHHGRLAVKFNKVMGVIQTHLCIANVLLAKTSRRDMTDVFTENSYPQGMDVTARVHRSLRATSKGLELHIAQIPLPLDEPSIVDITPNIQPDSLPSHKAHIKIVYKTSNPEVYTEAVLKGLTQTLVNAAILGFDTVGVHWG